MTAREAALTALERCRKDHAWSGASIDSAIKKYSLDRRDAALASRLCMGVLQNTELFDYYIDELYGKKLEPKLRDILRIGIYEILFLDKIPPRASVFECVELCKKNGFSRASGLVNALLRKVSDGNLPEIHGFGTAKYLSVKYSHPVWLAERLINNYGYEFTDAFFRADNEPPALDINVNTLKISEADYEKLLTESSIEFSHNEYINSCISLSGGIVSELPGYNEGLFFVQDRAARLAVEIAAPSAGMSILDACAAPGGKSFSSAIKMHNTGKILACDIHEKKLSLIKIGSERLGISIINVCASDARIFDEAKRSSFDLVIADVPCSGLGVCRKKPDIKTKSENEVNKLPEIQLSILDNLSKYVKPEGVLLYSTCTVLREENEDVVSSFLCNNNDYKPESFDVCGIKADKGMYTFWPHIDGTDGFFVAKLRRKN